MSNASQGNNYTSHVVTDERRTSQCVKSSENALSCRLCDRKDSVALKLPYLLSNDWNMEIDNIFPVDVPQFIVARAAHSQPICLEVEDKRNGRIKKTRVSEKWTQCASSIE
jgi:hypothetical protein